MKRFIKRIIPVVLILIGLFFLFRTVKLLPKVKSLFSSKPVLIEETPILISKIRALAALMTITYSDEVVVDTARPAIGIGSLVPLPGGAMIAPSFDKLVLIGRGKVIAGTNLKQLRADDIYQRGDSITLQVPRAKVLEVIVNPSGYEVFIEKGKWPEAAVTNQKVRIREELRNRALQADVLQKADARSVLLLENFLKNFGYTFVQVEQKPE